MELIWYGHWGRPILAFPTSLGRATQNEDGGIIRGLEDKIEGGEIQICCVDSVDEDSWYNKNAPPEWRVHRHDQYDRYLSSEVVPFIRGKAQREDIITYGASFGAYHAVNFAFRHLDHIARVIAFSPGIMQPDKARGKPPIYISHGTSDGVLPIGVTSRTFVPRLKKLGYDVTYHEFDGRHQVPDEIAREAFEWSLKK